MEPFQQRVIDEKNELDLKIGKLTNFIYGISGFTVLPIAEQDRLKRQLDHMRAYSFVLEERIKHFT